MLTTRPLPGLQWTPWVLPLFGGAVLAGAMIVMLLRSRQSVLGRPVLVMLGAGGWWSLAYALELLSPRLATKLVFSTLAHLGIVLLPLAALVMALHYAGYTRWLARRRQLFLYAIGAVMMAFVATNGWHHGVWREAGLRYLGPLPTLVLTPSWGFWILTGYLVLLFCAAFGLLLNAFRRSPLLYRRHTRLLLVCAILLAGAVALDLLALGPAAYLNMLPFALPLVIIAVAWRLHRVMAGELIPAALTAVVDDLPDAVVLLDREGRCLRLNPVAQTLVRKLAGSAAGDDMLGAQVSGFAPRFAAEMGPLEELTAPRELEFTTASFGDERIFDVRLAPFTDGGERALAAVVVIRDITAQRRSERALREQHRRLQALWTAVPDAVVVVGPDGRVNRWNAGAEELFGCSATAAVGQPVTALIALNETAATEVAGLSGQLARLARGETLPPTEAVVHRCDGKLLNLRIAGAPVVVDGELVGVVLVFTDVTELRQLAASLAALNEELETRVAARTAELQAANARLAEEIEERRGSEASLRQRNRELLSLQAAAAATASSLDLAFVLETMTWEMTDLLGVQDCRVYEWHADRQELSAISDFASLVAGAPPAARRLRLAPPSHRLRTLEEKYAQVVGTGAMVSDGDTNGGDPAGGATTGLCLLLPMVFQDKVVGLVELLGDAGHVFSDREISLGQILANQAAIAMDHARLYRRAQHEIAERQRAEAQIKASLHEKEMLLQEVHHRVKNNLQVISSLLNLQARTVQDPTTVEVLQESQNRLRSMALIHEKLYRSDNLAQIDFAEYLRGLTAYLVRSYKRSRGAVALRLHVEDIDLSIERAVPCGLIVNELISNALKYAFPEGRDGEIQVGLQQEGGRVRLTVRDNGVGLPRDFNVDKLDSLGLQLVHMLVEQLGGEIRIMRDAGTAFDISFAR